MKKREHHELCKIAGTVPNPLKVDFDSRYGHQLRRELLMHLKDRGGLKYRDCQADRVFGREDERAWFAISQ